MQTKNCKKKKNFSFIENNKTLFIFMTRVMHRECEKNASKQIYQCHIFNIFERDIGTFFSFNTQKNIHFSIYAQ